MRLHYDTDGGAATRAKLGLIVLHVDETIETEFRRLIDLEGVAVYCTRVPSGTELTERTLTAMAAEIPAAARLLPPAAALDVVGYACTSGATIIGPENVARAIREARSRTAPGTFAETEITDPLTAVKAACRALGVQRLGFVTPYVPSVSAAMRASLEADGLTIATFGSFEQAEERRVARITPGSIHDAILRVGRAADCDAVFVSCTNARTLEILEAAERDSSVPVISSNQALAWHMLRRAGIQDRRPGLGTLFTV